VDRRLNRYLKEMATVRKRERRMTLMSAKVKAVKREGQVMPESNSVMTLTPSPMVTRSVRGETIAYVTLTKCIRRVFTVHSSLQSAGERVGGMGRMTGQAQL